VAAVGALALVGGGVAVYAILNGRGAPEPRPAVADARVVATLPPDAAERASVSVDAPIVDIADAAVTPVDAAVVTRPAIAKRPVRPPPRVDPCGPDAKGPIRDDCFGTAPVRGSAPGFITIDSTPTFAVIFVDGVQYGETPLVMLKLSPGKHAVRAVAPSGAEKTLSITIASGKVAKARKLTW
jgi:hypothetical protein